MNKLHTSGRIRDREKAWRLLRGAACSAVLRSTENTDAQGNVIAALSKLADAIEDGIAWPLTEEKIEQVLGPIRGGRR